MQAGAGAGGQELWTAPRPDNHELDGPERHDAAAGRALEQKLQAFGAGRAMGRLFALAGAVSTSSRGTASGFDAPPPPAEPRRFACSELAQPEATHASRTASPPAPDEKRLFPRGCPVPCLLSPVRPIWFREINTRSRIHLV